MLSGMRKLMYLKWVHLTKNIEKFWKPLFGIDITDIPAPERPEKPENIC